MSNDSQYERLSESDVLFLNENLVRMINKKYSADKLFAAASEIDTLYMKDAIELYYEYGHFFWVPNRDHPDVLLLIKASSL